MWSRTVLKVNLQLGIYGREIKTENDDHFGTALQRDYLTALSPCSTALNYSYYMPCVGFISQYFHSIVSFEHCSRSEIYG